MGLNIREIIPKKQIEISDLKGKILCVDAFNTLYQFLSTIRQYDGSPLVDEKGSVTSHLSGLFYRNLSLICSGLKLIYVFDGKAPELKWKIHEKRGQLRDVAALKYESAKQEQDFEAMKSYSSLSIRLSNEMIAESKELLEAMGIGVVGAPGEGEAQASYMVRSLNEIYACSSQDYDSLLFGASRLVRNLTLSRKRKDNNGHYAEVEIELIELESVLNYLGISLEQLICLGIIIGTDYNPRGIPGIGQKRGLEIVRKNSQPVLIFESLKNRIEEMDEWEKFDWKEIFHLFKKPDVTNFKIDFPIFNENKIYEILVKKHNFSAERIEKQLDKLKDFFKKSTQKGLNKWF